MNLPDALVTGRAVLAVRGVLMACSIVPGRPDCVLGLTNPVMGRPDCVIGLEFRGDEFRASFFENIMIVCSKQANITWQLVWDLHPDLFQEVSVMSQVLKERQVLSSEQRFLTLRHWEELKLTCNLSNRALIQHHLSNPLLVDLNFIYVYHFGKSPSFQAPCSLWNKYDVYLL